MDAYILPILFLSALFGAWALFQLWTGRQADGSSIDADEIVCGDCAEKCAQEPDAE
ncbi:MAG TPA: hypothetical protein QGI39_12655 [Gammaproteobacteria bacterium]|jgi:hypothetical protein|nr:hypothetical protein [Gammaproteobacteria bacterium]|tara:strand:+ start:1298 stop:1465 length:168 start_codon:yes stop_codon:yes gene_type:complete